VADAARVGLDLWPATTHAPGAGRYARELVRALARLEAPPPVALLDVGPGPREHAVGLGLERLPAGWRRVEADLPRRALGALAALGLTAERLLGGCALFHRVLPGEPPLGAVPRVQPLSELPPPGSAGERALAGALEGSTDVVVFSEAARDEALRRFGALDPSRVHQLVVGCDHWLRDAAPTDVPDGPPLLLVLGRLDATRGPLPLLAAFERLHARGEQARLVWCGRPGDAADAWRAALSRSPARARVRWIESPVERELPALVASAAVLVHLAREEWTPVTPLEGAAFGAALLASPLPAFQEALGSAPCWVAGEPSSLDPEELAAALGDALASGLDAGARRGRRALAAPFTWARHAAATAALWARILAR
jgi:glycosyltransferase involved in cell wall biosynthesis